MARTRQPSGTVRLNSASRFARGLAFLFDGKTPQNVASGNILAPVNGPLLTPKTDGLRTQFVAASSQYFNCGTGVDVTFEGGPLTVAVRYSLTTAPENNKDVQLFSRDGSSGGRSYTVDVYRLDGNVSVSGLRIYANGGGTGGYNEVREGRSPAAGDDRFGVVVYDPSNNRGEIWIDGINVRSTTASTAIPSASTNASIGRRSYSGYENYLNGSVGFLAAWRRALSADEIADLSRNPWQLFAPDPRRIWVQLGAATGGGDVTGTSSSSLAATTGTATATAAIAGTSAQTLAATAGTAAGTLALAATSAQTLGAVTGAATGTTLGAATGTSAATLAATTGTAVGTLALAAASVAALAATTGTATAAVAVAGTSAVSLAATTGAATGTSTGATAGASAATLASVVGTAAGTLALAVTSSSTIGIVTGTSAGTISVGGASAQTLNDLTGIATGTTLGATIGSSAATLGSVTGTAAGHTDILATAAGTLAAISGAAAGQILIAGSSAGTLGAVTGPAPTTITSIDPRYLVPARGRQLTAKAKGRTFTART